MKYLIFFLPILAFANGNHEENSHHIPLYEAENPQETVSEPPQAPIILNLTDYSPCAANAAINGVPGISHHLNHTKHSAFGMGFGSCEDSSGVALGYITQNKNHVLKLNLGVSGDVTVLSGGLSVGF